MATIELEPGIFAPEVDHLITEDGAPVDSFFAEKQMRLLTEPLRSGWQSPGGRPFIVAANVGVFAVPQNPAIVPDVFFALDVEPRPVTGPKRLASYFTWEFGKPPDVVIEIVSREPNGELSEKLRQYERMRVAHYVVLDPLRAASDEELSVFALEGTEYVQRPSLDFRQAELSLCIWEGEFEDAQARWLRWCTLSGALIETGAERAIFEANRADEATRRAEKLAARLRALGIDPDGDK